MLQYLQETYSEQGHSCLKSVYLDFTTRFMDKGAKHLRKNINKSQKHYQMQFQNVNQYLIFTISHTSGWEKDVRVQNQISSR